MTTEQETALNLWMSEVSHALDAMEHFTNPSYTECVSRVFQRLHEFEVACSPPPSLRDHANQALQPAEGFPAIKPDQL